MKPIHIVAGLLALLAGAIALYATKGSPLHRRAGTVFVAAMLVMSSTGAVMALVAKPNPVNVMAGATTFYLVATGWLAVKRTVAEARGWLIGFMLGALALSATAWGLGLRAIASPTGTIGGVTPGPIFMFAVVALAGGLLDARLLRAGHIAGGQRLARHLWRLGFAMWIATLSFFLGQADVFPGFLRQNVGLRAVPVLMVAGVVAYWLVRVLRRRRAVLVQHTLGNP
jgi:uncharacterized membrane protein